MPIPVQAYQSGAIDRDPDEVCGLVSFRILIVDAYEAHRKVMVGFINHIRPNVEVHQFDPSIAGKPHADFGWAGYKLIVMDSRLGRENGLEWFKDYAESIEDFPPVLFLSSQNDVDIAVKAMKLGARDFVLKKGVKQSRLKQAILDNLPEPEPLVDIMPDLKPLPDHHSTLQYDAADTQILPESVRDKAEAEKMTEKEIEEETNNYWEEQTQILHEPPA